MFDPNDRDRIRDLIVQKARGDTDIVAAAAVGSSATGGDRWSDLDLTFAVAEGSTVESTLARWTEHMVAEFGAAVLFDVPVQTTIYRVFLLPGALQVDLSFSPAAEFGPRTPRFHLIFGETIERPFNSPPRAADIFGLGVHHVVRAHICIERGLLWQAAHWIHEARDEAMTLACQRHGLDVAHARGFDKLPPEVLAEFARTLVSSLEADELRRALAVTVTLLLAGAVDLPETVERVRPMLAEISQHSGN